MITLSLRSDERKPKICNDILALWKKVGDFCRKGPVTFGANWVSTINTNPLKDKKLPLLDAKT
jgi:hypothetical protein